MGRAINVAFESRFWLLGYKNECKLLTLMGMERFLRPTNVYCSQMKEGFLSFYRKRVTEVKRVSKGEITTQNLISTADALFKVGCSVIGKV